MLIVLLYCISLTGFFCGCSNANLNKGNQEAEKGNYKQAYEYYEKAGEEGAQAAKDLHDRIVKEHLDENDYYAALNYMKGYGEEKGITVSKPIQVPTFYTQEEAEQIVKDAIREDLLELQSENNKNFEAFLKAGEAYRANSSSALSEIENMLQHHLTMKSSADRTLWNDMYYLQGCISAYEQLSQKKNAKSMPYWEKCTSGPGAEIAKGIKMLQEGNYQEGHMQVMQNLPYPEAMERIIYAIIKKEKYDDREYRSLSQMLYHNNLLRKVDIESSRPETLTEAYPKDRDTEIGLSISYRNQELTDEMISELKTQCGTNPKGDILFIHVSKYERGNVVKINGDLMDLMPDAYYPEDLSTVEYIITFTGSEKETGRRYSQGTKQVQEKTVVTAYDMKTGKKIYSESKKGPVSNTMYYTGKVPDTYSAGSPNVSKLLAAALAATQK